MLHVYEEAWTVKHKTIAKSSRTVISVMYMLELKMKNCLKKVEIWTMAVVMSVMIVLKILGESVTKRNFTVHCSFVE